MTKAFFLLCIVAATASVVTADNLVTFPYSANPCSCVLLTCTCCTGVQVSKIGFSKNVCVVLTVKILSLSVAVTIQLDNKVLAQFSFSATNPPTYCIPIALPVSISMCLKIHDIKLVGLTALQMCMTMYAGYGGNNMFVVPFNCVKLSSGSMVYFTTTSTSSTTSTTTTTTPKTKSG